MISTEENTVRLPGPSMTPAEAETTEENMEHLPGPSMTPAQAEKKLKMMNGENWEKFKKKW